MVMLTLVPTPMLSAAAVAAHSCTDEGSLPDIAQYSPYYLPLNVFTASKGSNLYILVAITAAGAVPCGGHTISL